MSHALSLSDTDAMLQARHSSMAWSLDTEADVSYPITEISELMQSPCRPEESGYFGSTSGTPVKLFYEFEMESRKGTDIRQAAAVVQEHLMDFVLAATFPSICSFDGDGLPPSQKVAITGFRFGREQLDLIRTCSPESKSNDCNKVAGQIYIFGGDIEQTVPYTRSVINSALEGATTNVLSLGVQRVEPVAIQSGDPRSEAEETGGFHFHPKAIAGLGISFLCIVLGVALLVLYIKKDRARQRNLRSLGKRTMTDSTASVNQFRDRVEKPLERSENASLSSASSTEHLEFEEGSVSSTPSEMQDEYNTDREYGGYAKRDPGRSFSPTQVAHARHCPDYPDEYEGQVV